MKILKPKQFTVERFVSTRSRNRSTFNFPLGIDGILEGHVFGTAERGIRGRNHADQQLCEHSQGEHLRTQTSFSPTFRYDKMKQ